MVNIWYGSGNVNYLHCQHEIGYTSNTSVTVEYFPTCEFPNNFILCVKGKRTLEGMGCNVTSRNNIPSRVCYSFCVCSTIHILTKNITLYAFWRSVSHICNC
jgi:hypothetical protein